MKVPAYTLVYSHDAAKKNPRTGQSHIEKYFSWSVFPFFYHLPCFCVPPGKESRLVGARDRASSAMAPRFGIKRVVVVSLSLQFCNFSLQLIWKMAP